MTDKIRQAEEISRQVARLSMRLREWDLISALSYASHRPNDILVYALSKEARDLDFRILQLTYQLGDAAASERTEAYERLKASLGPLYEREGAIALAFREVLNAASEEKHARKESRDEP